LGAHDYALYDWNDKREEANDFNGFHLQFFLFDSVAYDLCFTLAKIA